MRLRLLFALMIGTTPAAFASDGFDIVVPSRPGVPIVVNGVDVSYAVLEGNFGLGKGVNNQPTIYGGHQGPPGAAGRSLLPDVWPQACLWPSRNRAAGQPQAAAAGRELSRIRPCTVGS